MVRILSIIVVGVVLGSAPSNAADKDAVVKISGSTSVANSIIGPHQGEIEKAAKVEIELLPSSSGAGVVDLAAGGSDIAMISSDLGEILAKVRKTTLAYNLNEQQLQKLEIGQAKIEFIVNSSNPVTKLSADQIKRIFLGKITNWKDVGGANADIRVFSEPPDGAMRAILEHDFLGGEMSSRAVELNGAPKTATAIAGVPTGVGFVSSTTPSDLRRGTVTIDTDVALIQHLALITKGAPSPAVARVFTAVKELVK